MAGWWLQAVLVPRNNSLYYATLLGAGDMMSLALMTHIQGITARTTRIGMHWQCWRP